MSRAADVDLAIPYFRTPGCRPRSIDVPTPVQADPGDYQPDEDEFIRAVARFRSVNKIASPTLCQLLWVLKRLGYRHDVQP